MEEEEHQLLQESLTLEPKRVTYDDPEEAPLILDLSLIPEECNNMETNQINLKVTGEIDTGVTTFLITPSEPPQYCPDCGKQTATPQCSRSEVCTDSVQYACPCGCIYVRDY